MPDRNNTITYSIKAPVFEIHFNNEENLNSLTIREFIRFAELLNKANENKDTVITLVTSSSKFFSTGANIKKISKLVNREKEYYYKEISSSNIYLVNTILSHKKILVAALNGPVIGLSASLVCLFDIIYARRSKTGINPYISLPFANIGLVNECGISGSLVNRIGLSKTLEAVCFAEKINLDELFKLGLINRCFDVEDVNEFNDFVKLKVSKSLIGLDFDAILENKQLVKQNFKKNIECLIVEESMLGLNKWVENKPQNAFVEILKGKRKHKL